MQSSNRPAADSPTQEEVLLQDLKARPGDVHLRVKYQFHILFDLSDVNIAGRVNNPVQSHWQNT